MSILYISDKIPEYVRGGIILFNLKDRVMSRIKNRVWKTLSHAGILYQSMVSGQPTTWLIYMDEIYGLISSPLHVFIHNENLERNSRGWALRYIPNFDGETSRKLNRAISKHAHEDSNMALDEDNHIEGSFDDELKAILGILPEQDGSHKPYNTNIGFVLDVLREFWIEMEIEEGEIPSHTRKVGFTEDEIAEDDLVRSFNTNTQTSTEELLNSVNQLLSMVNLTTHTIEAPIQPLITKPIPLFDTKLIVPSEDFYSNARGIQVSSIYPKLTEERQHVAAVISRMFESGLGTEGVREFFEEELETTTLARRGRNDLTREYVRDLCNAVIQQLVLSKSMLSTLKNVDRISYNSYLQGLVVAQGSLLAHLNIEDIPLNADVLKL